MIPAGPLHQLLRKARQRCVVHLALDGLLLALTVSFGAVAVVLLAGTEMLGFYWIAAAAAAGLALSFYLLRKRTPLEYAVAQKIDERMKLADTLSTAAYFADAPTRSTADLAIRALQQRRAEEVAGTVDIPRALPLARPRMLVPAGVLALLALGVFLFRFAITGSFDPRASLIKNALEALTGPPGEGAKKPTPATTGDQTGDGEQDEREMAQKNDFAGDPASEPDPQSPENQTEQPGDSKDGQQPPEDADSPDMSSPPGDPSAPGDKDKQGEDQNNKQNSQQNQDQSMMDKVKQALSEMLSKMKPQAGDSKGQSKKSDSSQAKQQKSESKDDSEGDSSEESGADEDAANSQDDSKKSANRQSKDQQSGAGANEGDKAQRLADALKAMGKISELLGKRAENVTGSVLVEVGSTKQQMKTPTAQSAATHAEAGGEIHRDEVPPMYEQFVQQYFEQIRKTPAAEAVPARAER